jgi:hypothetical protein
MGQATYFAQSRPYGLLRTGRVELRTGIPGSYLWKSAPMARGILYKIEHWESHPRLLQWIAVAALPPNVAAGNLAAQSSRRIAAGAAPKRARLKSPRRVPRDRGCRGSAEAFTNELSQDQHTSKTRHQKKALGDRRQEWRFHCQIPHTETSSYLRTLAVPRGFERSDRRVVLTENHIPHIAMVLVFGPL